MLQYNNAVFISPDISAMLVQYIKVRYREMQKVIKRYCGRLESKVGIP